MNLMRLPAAIVLLLLSATVTPGPNNLLMLRIGLESGLRPPRSAARAV
jgi:threonine/homoserine/homoserine lactone efflux protein